MSGVGVFKYFLVLFSILSAVFGAVIIFLHELRNPTPIELYFFKQVMYHSSFTSNITIPIGIISLGIAVYLYWRIGFEKYTVLHRRLVYMFFILISILAVFANYLYSQRNHVAKKSKETLQRWVQEYHDRPLSRSILDYIQTELECCGVTNVDDWNYHANGIPPSCCVMNFTSKDICLEENVFSMGCAEAIENLVEQNQMKFFWIIVDLAVVTAIMLVSSVILRFIQIKEEKRLK